MRKIITLLTVFLAVSTNLFAKDPPDSAKIIQELLLKRIDSIEKKFHYKTGSVLLANGLATINVPKSFKFLEADEAEYVIADLWGNPKGNKPLGLIVPANEPASITSFAFIVEYNEIGYVKDKDADKIDYDKLLKDMKETQVAANQERKRLGMDEMNLVGWASPPYYDKDKKVLYWAKEYQVTGSDDNTLNYDIRVLGRKGVLNLEAVASMSAFDSVKSHISEVLGMVSFNEGHKYSNFNSNTDKVAAWTIGGLVAGKILAKVGLWAIILKFLKFIILGIAVAGGAVWRFITGKKKKQDQEEYQHQPQQYPINDASGNEEKLS